MSINFFKHTLPNMIKASLCESEAVPSAINFGIALISGYYKIFKPIKCYVFPLGLFVVSIFCACNKDDDSSLPETASRNETPLSFNLIGSS